MERKFLAKLLAVSMVVTAVPVLPGIGAGADAKELSVLSQETKGYLAKSNRTASGGAVTDNPYAIGNVLSNPFEGKDTSNGIEIEFDVEPTGEAKALGIIFSINNGTKTLHFSSASYLGANIGDPGYFDANLKNYGIVQDYIGSGGKVNIKIIPAGLK